MGDSGSAGLKRDKSEVSSRSGEGDGGSPAGPLTRTPGLVLGASAMVAASAFKLVSQLAVLPVLARLLGPEAYGLVGLAMPFIFFANMLCDGGLGPALTREQKPTGRLESTVFWMSLGIGTLLAIGIWLLAAPIAHLFKHPALAPVLIGLALILPMCGALAVPNARIGRAQRFAIFAIGDVAAAVISAIAAIAAAVLGWGAWSLVLQQLTFWGVKLLWLFPASGFRPRPVFDGRTARPYLRFGLTLIGGSISDFFSRSAPVVVLGSAASTGAVGSFTMATQLARLPETIIVGPVYLSVFTSAARAHAAGEGPGAMLSRTWRLGLLVLTPLFAGVALTADFVTAVLLGSRWADTHNLVQALSPAAFCGCLIVLIVGNLQAIGRPDVQLRLSILSSAAIAVGAFAGLPMGALGVALGVSAATAAVLPVYMLSAYRIADLRPHDILRDTLGPLGATFIMSLAVVACRGEMKGLPEWVQLAACIAVGGIAYGAAVTLLFRRSAYRDLMFVLRRDAAPVGS
jgi:polysaccharide transporter, PST family